jgi:Zn-dependent peptidase ImmA (M78 family)
LPFYRGFKSKANKISLKIRAKLGLRAVDPIDPAKVCELFDITLTRMSELDCDWRLFAEEYSSSFSAVTVSRGGQTAIIHNDFHHPYRQRSNICHELSHCFLGHESVPPLTESGDRFHDGGVEAEANFLGGALLIPNEAAIYILRKGLTQEAQGIYGVSKPMLDFRLRVSGAQTIHARMQWAS